MLVSPEELLDFHDARNELNPHSGPEPTVIRWSSKSVMMSLFLLDGRVRMKLFLSGSR